MHVCQYVAVLSQKLWIFFALKLPLNKYWAIPFLSVQGYGGTNPRGPLIMIFSRVFFISRYIFPGGKFAQLPFFRVGDWIFFQVSSFSKGSNCVRFNSRVFISQTIIVFQAALVFKNLVVRTPVWTKNGIAHCNQNMQQKFVLNSTSLTSNGNFEIR